MGNKTALITGAARRLGREVALALAGKGINIIIHYNKSSEDAKKLKQELLEFNVKTQLIQADLADNSQVDALINNARQLTGKLDILINSASIFPENNLMTITRDDIYKNMDINTIAPFILSRSFYQQAEKGVIINFLDTRILKYDQHYTAYHISKRMLHTFNQMMALEFAPRVRVNAIAPGFILPQEGKAQGFFEKYAKKNPLNCYGTTKNITDSVIFLLENDFITGQVLYIDGGTHLYNNTYGY